MARLSTAQRNALPDSDFAGPGRSYPINDASHARNAMSRAAQNATPAQRATIAAKVHKKFPKIGQSTDRVRAIATLEARRVSGGQGGTPNLAAPKLGGSLPEPRDLGSGQPRGGPQGETKGMRDPRERGSGIARGDRRTAVTTQRGGSVGMREPRELGSGQKPGRHGAAQSGPTPGVPANRV